MAYRIDYGKTRPKTKSNNNRQLSRQVMTAACLLLFVLLVKNNWPEGTDKLRSMLLPGGKGTQTAIETMVEGIREGESVGQVLSVFCKEIIENAQTD